MEKYLLRPDNCYFGDCMPFYNSQDHLFYLYFQKDTRNPVPFGDPFGWELATTTDFVKYKMYGEVLKRGNETDNDQFIYAGSVFKNEKNQLITYYTGYNRNFIKQERSSQVLMKAHSLDGKTWAKDGLISDLVPQIGYDVDDWRDPYIIWDDNNKKYLLILGTRLKSDKKEKTGRIVYFTSDNGEHWSFKGDFWAPNLYTMIEMPQIFKIGEWWYLVYSEYDMLKTTHYVMSKSIMGPWQIPSDDTFNGRAYYAARTATNGSERYLFGWVPSKEAGKDENNYLWGGTFLPLQVIQKIPSGELSTQIPKSLKEAVEKKISFPTQKIESKFKRTEVKLRDAQIGKHYLLSNKISFSSFTRNISIMFFQNENTGEGYEFNISLNRQELSVCRTPNLRWYQMLNIGLNRQLNLKPNKFYQLNLFVDDTIAILNIDGVTLSCRIQKNTDFGLSIAVTDGVLNIKN